MCKCGDMTAVCWAESYGAKVEKWEQGRVRGKMARMKGCGSYEQEWWRNNGLNFNNNKRGGWSSLFSIGISFK